jgi:hypothetical protein
MELTRQTKVNTGAAVSSKYSFVKFDFLCQTSKFGVFQDQDEYDKQVEELKKTKIPRLKEGLNLWSKAHQEMSKKSLLIFTGIHKIAQLLPDGMIQVF